MRRLRKKKKFFKIDIFIVGLVLKRHRFASDHLLKQLFQLFAKHHYIYDHIPGACTIKSYGFVIYGKWTNFIVS
jgi:hypothetical protein